MQTSLTSLMAYLHNFMAYWKTNLDRWDRVYLCSAAPLSAELMRDYEEAERHHSQY